VPADCAMRKGSALSLSLASGLASPPFWLTSLLSTAPRLELDRIGSRAGFGALSLRTTVKGSGVRMSSTPFRKNAGLLLAYRTRSNDHLTSADVSGFPLAKRTLRRSLNVYVFPSGDTVQSVASDGLGVVRSSPSKVTSES